MTMRKMGDVATDVLLDEVLGGRVDEMLLNRDTNLGALLRLRRHFPKAAMKLTDEQWVYLSEMYEGGMAIPIDDGNMEVHHILPVAQGGGDEAQNLVSLCHSCHQKRHMEMKGEQP